MLTRRKLLASTPALAVAVATPAAAVCTMPTSEPDAELLRLGAEFERQYEAWKPYWRTMHAMGETWQEFARSGRFADFMDAWRTPEGDAYEAAIETNNEKLTRLDELAKRIRAIPPSTLAGLMVHARVCRFDCLPLPKLEEAREDWDWDVECLTGFLEHVERMAGSAVQS
ncbi:hypothetical protein [Mesorhizobium sp. CN2-181]|uniref:hypothetical protein n=1 Tax=Mesorhizobium yinganensis TaxID=3157707 RepID=UPI0032B7BE97